MVNFIDLHFLSLPEGSAAMPDLRAIHPLDKNSKMIGGAFP